MTARAGEEVENVTHDGLRAHHSAGPKVEMQQVAQRGLNNRHQEVVHDTH